MRNNSDRAKSMDLEHDEEALEKAAGAFSNENQDKTKNTGELKFVSPTEVVELPSNGKFYGDNHPFSDGTAEIRQVTTAEEDILNNKTLIKKNLMINRFVSSILVDQVPVNDILAGDKDAIVLNARITAYGSEMPVKSRCMFCEAHLDLDYHLGEDVKYNNKSNMTTEEQEATRYDYDAGIIYITVPKWGYEVGMKVSSGKEQIMLQKQRDRSKKNAAFVKRGAITDMYSILIKSVEGKTDDKTISEFIRKLPASDSRFLRNTYRKAAPGIKIEKHFECPECGMPDSREVGFNAEFFWPTG